MSTPIAWSWLVELLNKIFISKNITHLETLSVKGMTRKSVTIVTFAVHVAFTLLASLAAVYLLMRLSQKVQRQSKDKMSSNEFQQQKKLCSAACPGPMNCTEWSDCIFHQPDHCDKLQLLCFYEESTLFSDVVLTYSGFNWYDIGRIVTLDLFMFLLVIGLVLMSIWCFQSIWTNLQLTNMSMIAHHGSNAQATHKSRRGIYAAVGLEQSNINPTVTETGVS